jgi:hypothetical protein
MLPGAPTIAFLAGRSELIATVTVKDGTWINSTLWSGDVPLANPQALAD